VVAVVRGVRHLKRIFDLDVKLAGVRRWRTMARLRVLALGLVGSGCFADNGPPQGGATASTSEVGVTTSAAVMSTSGSTSGTGARTSGGVDESSEVSTSGEATTVDPETSDPTGPETTDEPVPAGCPADAELRACYRFETLTDMTPDESSYMHPAKVSLAALATGRLGMGLDVTAMSQVQASDADHLTPGQSITMTAWFNPRTLPTEVGYRMVILDKDSEYGIIIRPGGIGCTFSSGIPQVQAPVLANKWTHVACVHTPEGVGALYLDGVPIGMEETGALEMVELDRPLAIGNDSPLPKPTDGFDGVIDEVKIWARVLSAEEIQAQANP
jgi:hypothetical protein